MQILTIYNNIININNNMENQMTNKNYIRINTFPNPSTNTLSTLYDSVNNNTKYLQKKNNQKYFSINPNQNYPQYNTNTNNMSNNSTSLQSSYSSLNYPQVYC